MKEDFEWIRSWTDLSNNEDLPRILLIGDSITEGYQELVRNGLKGVCYVDYIATSYPVNRTMYQNLITSIANDSTYDLIHFNHGLHGFEMSLEDYKAYINKVISSFRCKNIIMVTSTRVNLPNTNDEDLKWGKVLKDRNMFIKTYALENKFILNDLFELSQKIENKDRLTDGFHYQRSGYEILANQVVKSVKIALAKSLTKN